MLRSTPLASGIPAADIESERLATLGENQRCALIIRSPRSLVAEELCTALVADRVH